MSAALDTSAAAEVAKMTKVQKLAALLVMLGRESAAGVLKNLDEQELDAVTGEMTKLSMISQETQGEILREFTEVAVRASTSLRGGIDYTQASLEKGSNIEEMTEAVHVACAIRGGASLAHGVQMRNVADKLSM